MLQRNTMRVEMLLSLEGLHTGNVTTERKELWARSLQRLARSQLRSVLGVSHGENYLTPLSLSFHYIMMSTVITLRAIVKTKWLKNMKVLVSSALCKY